MKREILVTREVFDDVLDYLADHFEVSANKDGTLMAPRIWLSAPQKGGDKLVLKRPSEMIFGPFLVASLRRKRVAPLE